MLILMPGTVVNAQTLDSTNIMCVEALRVPTFTHLAHRATNGGSVDARVLVGQDGSIKQLSFVSSNEHLQREVEIFLRGLAKFKPSCEGRTVALRFDYRLEEGSASSAPVTKVTFFPPNRFELASGPLRPTID